MEGGDVVQEGHGLPLREHLFWAGMAAELAMVFFQPLTQQHRCRPRLGMLVEVVEGGSVSCRTLASRCTVRLPMLPGNVL